ncbi:MAG: FAD-dependent monooxygenase [Pseudomonadota bacterium]
MRTLKTDIVIVGAGPVGLSLYLAFAKLNKRVLLLDRADALIPQEQEWDARNYALAPQNIEWLNTLGLSDAMMQAGTPMEAMHVVYEAGKAFFELSAHQLREPYLAWMVRHDKLCIALAQAIYDTPFAQGISQAQIYPQGVWSKVVLQQIKYSAQAAYVQLEHEGHAIEVETKLVIGADGVHSWVREQTGIAIQTQSYSHKALVGCFETEYPHGGIAYQWFKENGDVMAWLPMPEGVGVVWSSSTFETSCKEMLHDPQAIADELSQSGHKRLGEWRYLGGLAIFPLMHQSLKGILPERIMLVGDARQRIHPLAGQGVNLGLVEAQHVVKAIETFPFNDPGHPWIRSAISQKESLMQKILPWGVDTLWRLNQPGRLPEPAKKLIGLGWQAFHQSGMLKRMVSQWSQYGESERVL